MVSRRIGRLADPAAFPAWAYRITSNKSRDWIRRRRRMRSADEAYGERWREADERSGRRPALRRSPRGPGRACRATIGRSCRFVTRTVSAPPKSPRFWGFRQERSSQDSTMPGCDCAGFSRRIAMSEHDDTLRKAMEENSRLRSQREESLRDASSAEFSGRLRTAERIYWAYALVCVAAFVSAMNSVRLRVRHEDADRVRRRDAGGLRNDRADEALVRHGRAEDERAEGRQAVASGYGAAGDRGRRGGARRAAGQVRAAARGIDLGARTLAGGMCHRGHHRLDVVDSTLQRPARNGSRTIR